MKIAVVQGPYLPVPPLRGGAIEKRWHSLTTEFQNRGHDVDHYTRAFEGLPNDEQVGRIHYRRAGGSAAPDRTIKNLWADFQYALGIRKILQPADVIVTHTILMPLLVPRSKVPKVCVHVARMPKGQMKLYRKADRLQAVSQAVARAIERQEPSLAPKVKVFPNALPLGWAEGARPANEPRDNAVLYVGRVHPEKGVHLLVEAWSKVSPQLPDWELRLVGPIDVSAGGGGIEYEEKLRNLVPTGPIGDSVRFIGPIYDIKKLKSTYDQAAVLAYPSVADEGESFGMAPLEAMARGCVPVISGLECFTEFAESDRNAFVFDHHAEDRIDRLANQIVSAVHAPLAVRQAGLDTAARFTTQVAAQRFLDDFEILTGKPANLPTNP